MRRDWGLGTRDSGLGSGDSGVICCWTLGRSVLGLVVAFIVLLSASALWMMTPRSLAASQPAPKPTRIISLVPAVTEMLFAIGAGDRVIAVSTFDRFPPEVDKLPRVGALLDPNVERMLSLRPDLVVVYHSQTDLLTQLRRAQIPSFLYAHAGLAGVTATIRQLGERIGDAARANQVADDIEARIDSIRARSKDTPRPRTAVVFSRDAFVLRGMFASGGKGFIHDMVTAAGGDNVFADVARESLQVTTELLIARRPDVILELRPEPIDAATQAKELETWSTLSSIPAVRQRRVHIIADPRTVVPGARVAEGVELFWRALQEGR